MPDIELLGNTYTDVPAVTLPTADGNSATFVYSSFVFIDNTATFATVEELIDNGKFPVFISTVGKLYILAGTTSTANKYSFVSPGEAANYVKDTWTLGSSGWAHDSTTYVTTITSTTTDTHSPVSPYAVRRYVDSKIKSYDSFFGYAQSSSTASKAYTSGELFVYDSALYQAITDIASGETLSSTNCQVVDLDTLINDINTDVSSIDTLLTSSNLCVFIDTTYSCQDVEAILAAGKWPVIVGNGQYYPLQYIASTYYMFCCTRQYGIYTLILDKSTGVYQSKQMQMANMSATYDSDRFLSQESIKNNVWNQFFGAVDQTNSLVASRDYQSGQFLVYNCLLYLVTQNIARGAQIKINTSYPSDYNCMQITVQSLYSSKNITSTSVSQSGLVSFNNASGVSQFTLQLPLYDGGVS